MSDVNIPGVTNNRINSQKMMDAIMNAERVPLKRMETEMDGFKKSKKIWQDFNLNLTKLKDSANELFSFNSPFSAKKAVSSDETILTAVATRKAVVTEKELKVKQVATADRFMSDSVGKDFKVGEGNYRFTIGEKEITISFHGGSLQEFADAINKKGGTYLHASVVNNTAKTQVFVLESLITGEKNKLTFHDDAVPFAEQIGMIKKTATSSLDVSISEPNIEKTDAPLDATKYQIENGTLTVKPQTELQIPIKPPFPLTKNMVLEYEVKTTVLKEEELKQPDKPPGPTIPETGSIEYKGIKIYSEKSIVILPEEKVNETPPRVDDMTVLSYKSNGEKHALPDVKDTNEYYKVSFPIGQTTGNIEGIIVENKNTNRNISIRNIKITDPTVRGDYTPTNPLSQSHDAIIEYNGVEIIRDTNTITDLIPEVTVNLHEQSDKKVKLSVQYDTEAMKAGIVALIGNYNRIVTEIDILTRSDSSIIEKAGYLSDAEKEKALDRLALLKGDVTLMQLKSNLQTIMMNGYKTSGGSEMSLLSQIGISTNAGTSGTIDKSTLRGYLQIDESKLDNALKSKPELIRELFGNDVNGDLVVDSGVAFSLDARLKPYVQIGGIITTHLQTIDTQMTRKQKEITDFQKHLEDYERELKKKYGQMEGMIDQLNKSNQQLQNMNNSQNK
jgi:flagellar hook-associated protein 2